jgi:hypothetical protein
MLSPDGSQPNGLAVVNVDPTSERYGQIVHQVIMPNTGGEFHHFGWKACPSACVTFLVFAYDRFWFFALTGEGGYTNQHYRHKMRRWPGFRTAFAAQFSPAGLTGCGREMAQHSGIDGQGHTQTRFHRQPIWFVDVNNTPAAPKYCGAASGRPKSPVTQRAAAGFDVAGPLLHPHPSH